MKEAKRLCFDTLRRKIDAPHRVVSGLSLGFRVQDKLSKRSSSAARRANLLWRRSGQEKIHPRAGS